MIYDLLCCHCDSRFKVSFGKNETFPESCPHCHTAFEPHEIAKLNDFLDKMDSYNERFASLRIVQATESVLAEQENQSVDSTVFSSDVQQIKRMYDDATGEDKALLTSVIDKLYLLINRDHRGKAETLCSTKRVYELLEQEFLSSIDAQNKVAAETLGTDL